MSRNNDRLLRRYRYCIWLLAAAFFSAYLGILYNRFITYSTGDDFGLFMQSLGDASGLLRNTVEGSHYANHFSPIYELLILPTRWTHSAVPIMAAQAAAGALVAPGLFEIGRRMLPAQMAFGIAFVALIYPPLAGLVSGDPYENVFAPAVTIWLVLAVYRRYWVSASLLAVVALAVKEDQAAILACGALILFFVARRKQDDALMAFSACLFVACLATLGLYLLVIRRSIVGSLSLWPAFELAFRSTGNSGGVLSRLHYLLLICVPLGFLPVFAPPALLLLVIAPIVEILFMPNSIVRTIGNHYAGVWIGYTLVAAVFGLARVFRKAPDLAAGALTAAIALSVSLLLINAMGSETHVGQTQHDRDLDRILTTRLPENTTIGAPDVLYGHLWNRREAELGALQSPHYVVLDMNMKSLTVTQRMLRQLTTREFGDYRPVWHDHGVVLFVRANHAVLVHPGTRVETDQ
jgi:uncharacterized membrane protein